MIEPKLRFKADDESQFPDWEEKKISDIFSKVKEKNKDGQNQNVITNSAEFGLINQRDFFDKDIAVDGKTENYTVIKTGDFVYNPRKSKQAPYGPFNCYHLEKDGIVSPLYTCLRPKGIADNEYLQWYFQSGSWYRFIYENGAQNGARHDRVGMTDSLMQEIPVHLPQLAEEQQKIAEFLSTIDTVIEKQKETVSAWEERKKGVMQKLFSQEVRFKADDGSEFPDWEEKKLGEVGDIVTGNTPSTKQNDYYGECYLWVTPTDITDSREVTSTAKMLTELGYTVARHIPANSILVTCIASIGKNAILRENGSCNQQINSITPYDEYSVEFVYYLICQNEKLLHENAGTGGMEILNKENFSKIKMYFPCLAEQQKIADCLSSLDEVIEKQKATLSAWEEMKKGLLQQMFV